MKQFSIILVLLGFLSLGLVSTSCGNKKDTPLEQQGKEYTSAYICPMHCDGSGSDEAGTCPVCGMDYEKNKDHNADGYKH